MILKVIMVISAFIFVCVSLASYYLYYTRHSDYDAVMPTLEDIDEIHR